MTTLTMPSSPRGTSIVPADVAAWTSEHALVHLALRAAESIEGIAVLMTCPQDPTDRSAGPMLLTLMTYSYARGVLAACDIERFAMTDPDARYLSAGRRPNAGTLMQFRRQHRRQLQECLGRLLGLAWQERVLRDRRDWFAESAFMDFPAEAASRVDRAVRIDSMMMDD